jgi:hypothetical protein
MYRPAGVLAALALLLAGCGGTSGAGGNGAADIVPASAPLFVSIDSDPGSAQWKSIMELANKFPDKQKAIDAIKKSISKDGGPDWEHDLKPALGPEIDLVMLDLEHPSDVVALMQPKDENAFRRAVMKGEQRASTTRVFYEKFRGWEVISDKQSAIDSFKRASDSAKGTLANDSAFKDAMSKAGDGALRLYVNGSKVMGAISKYGGPSIQPYIEKLGTLDWLAMTLRAKSDGIAFDTVVHGTPGKLFTNVHIPVSDGSLTRAVPQDALLYFAFHGTKGMLGPLEDNPVLQQPGLRKFSDVLHQIGSILQGENALYVRAPPEGGRLPEVTFVAAPGGGVDGAATLDSVLNRFNKELGGRPQRTTVAGVPTRVLGTGRGVAIRYANVGGTFVVSDFPSAIEFLKNGGKPLSESQTYNDTLHASGAPARPVGILYVDIHSTIPVVERLANTPIPAGVKQNLGPLRSAVEYAVARSHELKISFFLHIK